MKYPVYPEMKDSGVEWLGEIPKHWEVKKLKYASKLIYGDSLPSDEREKGNYPVYGSNGVVGNHSKYNTISPAIIIGRKGSYGKINYSEMNCFSIDTTYYVDSKASNVNIRWFYYVLQNLRLDEITFDTGVPGLSRELAYNKYVPNIKVDEQKTIANFLDIETGRIDKLIEKKVQLIELLQEKRQALISHAVTKGLDSDVAMKDSGISWLEEIPEHWEVVKLKYIAKVVLGKMLQNNDTGSDFKKPYLKAKNIYWGYLDLNEVEEMWFSESELKKYKLHEKDLVVCEGGEVVRTAIWNNDMNECYIQNSVHKITFTKNNISRYYLYLFVAYGKRGFFNSIVNQVSISHLTREKLIEIFVINPPLQEQQEIVEYLDKETNKIDTLIDKITKQISNLKEYRQALISNAVTGKIDVREIYQDE